MPHDSPSTTLACERCGAAHSMAVEGLCSQCLLRLALVSEPEAERFEAAAPALTPGASVAGQRLGNYELIEEIFRGGMGIVYRARQVNAGRVVAVKVMLPALVHIKGMRERFRREIEAVAHLDHPGILPIFEVDEHAGLPLFSMKFAERGSLAERIPALAGRWREIAALVVRLAQAVEYAHGRGVLHRDLKPANILFDAHDAPMIADFGLARFRDAEGGLTLPASALGSPNYMAPEQAQGIPGAVGPRTDVYGLGAILYETLTGEPPVVAADLRETLRRVVSQSPRPCHELAPEVPRALEAITMRCLEKQSDARPTSAAELARDLQNWLANPTQAGVPGPAAKRPWWRLFV